MNVASFWRIILRHGPPDPAPRRLPTPALASAARLPAPASDTAPSAGEGTASWSLVVRRGRRRGRGGPPQALVPRPAAVLSPAGAAHPGAGAVAPAARAPPAEDGPPPAAAPPQPSTRAVAAVEALTRARARRSQLKALETHDVAGVARDARSHRRRTLVADAVGVPAAAVVDVDFFSATAAAALLPSAVPAFREGLDSPGLARAVWEVASAELWSPLFFWGPPAGRGLWASCGGRGGLALPPPDGGQIRPAGGAGRHAPPPSRSPTRACCWVSGQVPSPGGRFPPPGQFGGRRGVRPLFAATRRPLSRPRRSSGRAPVRAARDLARIGCRGSVGGRPRPGPRPARAPRPGQGGPPPWTRGLERWRQAKH